MNVAPQEPQTLPALLEANAVRWAGRPAIHAGDRPSITHDALWHRVNAGRSALRDFGIGPEDRVALMLPQGPDLALAFLTVACSAAAAPLNPASSEPDREWLFPDLNPKALVLPMGRFPSVRTMAARLGIPVLDWEPGSGDAGGFRFHETNTTSPGSPRDPRPDDVALILNTSGTTARPKRIPLSHANLLASVRAIIETLGLQPDDRCLSVMPLFHIHGLVASLLSPLGAGGSTVCTPPFDPDLFLELLQHWSPT